MCKPAGWWILLAVGFQLAAQETVLDPSIFDGTGTETGEREPEEKTPGIPEPTDGEAAGEPPGDLPIPEGPASAEDSGEVEPEDPPDVDGERVTEAAPPAEEELSEEIVPEIAPEQPGSPGSPTPAAEQSRAGEEVETRDRIAPGQGVDLPWNL